ncbi:unnamed protein product [marine sediment metagenome]|uniref:Uncharacterized protein n=1 Tax=marine sediment metagenome TaxID=412755 RepID=X0ZXN3_9ZZZZ
MIELSEDLIPDYSLCGDAFWCDYVCRWPWNCKYKIAIWKEKHPDKDFEWFKNEMKKKIPMFKR